jgi:hypothetical protein
MARAPARLAPPIKVWLRGFGAGCVTENSLPLVALRGQKKLKTIIPWDDGLEFYSIWLGRHHPLGFIRTATNLIRTTIRAAHSAAFAEMVRPFVMATGTLIARVDSRMDAAGQ